MFAKSALKSHWQQTFWGLKGQLIRNFALVIGLTFAIIGLVLLLIAPIRLDNFSLFVSRRQAYRIAPFFAEHYAAHRTWEGVEVLIDYFQTPLPLNPKAVIPPFAPLQARLNETTLQERVILTDSHGQVLFDSSQVVKTGQAVPAELTKFLVPIEVEGEIVGTLAIRSEFEEVGIELMKLALWSTLLGAMGLVTILAFPVAFSLAQRITQPLTVLSQAAQRLASGTHLPAPIPHRDDEIGHMTHAFNEMVADLATQKQLRQQMVADIAHELRTPLSVMKLEVEGLEDGLQSPQMATKALHSEISILEQLIEDLRLLSLADAGELQLELQEINPSQFLGNIATMWQTSAEKQNVSLNLEVPAHLPPILADPRRLTQVFNNLLANALRYTPSGGVVAIGGVEDQTEVRLWVADSGSGIAAEKLPYIFERFYRANSSRSRETGGSGLGLAIAKQLIQLHGGRIWAESEGRTIIYVQMNIKSSDLD